MPINVKDTFNGSNFVGTINGYSVSKSVPSNAVFTDTNTWRPVVDNLTSTATDQSLSANQGKVLKALVDGKAAASHGTHVTYGTTTTALTSGGTGVVGSSSTLARADHTHTLPAYPTALKSPYALTISLNGTSQGAFDGSAAKTINITASSIGAAASSHSHSYLPLSGGTMTGATASSVSTGTHLAGNQGTAIINSTAAGSGYNMLAKMNSTNGVWTMGSWGTSFNLFYTVNSVITAGTNVYTKRLSLLDESGNSSFPGTVTASAFSGNASSATKLATARTLTIGSTGKTFDGSANVSWSLSEIGAAASSHTHNYAGSSSAGGAATTALACTGNAATATKLATARTINGTSFDGSANITITAAANGGTSAACSGNSATATKLATARTLTIGSTGKTFDGSGNVSWTLAEIGAAASSHGTHISDTGWKNFTLATGISLASGGVARYRKINNMVYVEMNVTGVAHAGGGATALTTTLATLPSGYRPSSYLPVDATAGASQPNPCRIECNTNGTIRFRSSLNKVTAEYTLHVSFSFMI